MAHKALYLFRHVLASCLLWVTFTVQADIGIDWITSQSQSDGSYATATELATNFQATSETLTTLYALAETSKPGIPEAHQYISDEFYQGTEYLSRQIISNIQQGNNVTELVTTLLSYQNRDSGFGELPGYDSTALDTAFALETLALAGETASHSLGLASSFVTSHY